MTDTVVYKDMISDSTRWDRFEFRSGDIIVSTPPKCGTTWTQMLCALLVFDGPEFPATIDQMSPWFDMLMRSDEEAIAAVEALTHRRFLKTHTPLDGMPERDDVSYVVVGRDPRDLMVSFEHHVANIDGEKAFATRMAAVGLEGMEDLPAPEMPSEDPAERFRAFVENEGFGSAQPTLRTALNHLQTGWDRRHQPNVGIFHFSDYQRDLVAEMERLAALLDIDLSRERLAELAPEAGIGRMRERADEVAPDTTKNHYRDTSKFFRSGASGEWRERTTEADRDRYDERVTELTEPDFAAWVHGGRFAEGVGTI